MGLRPGKCYRRIKRAYSRVAMVVPKRNYIGAAPGLKIRQFNMGNPFKEFSHILDLCVEDSVQIRDNAFESTRIAVNRFLERRLGKEGYFFKIRSYPNQLLRERKLAQGAGADRVSQGMSHAFGKAVGRAVQTRPGQIIMSVLVDEKDTPTAKTALLRAGPKMPTTVKVKIHTDVKSIGTKPKKMREEAAEEEKKTEGEAAAAEATTEEGKKAEGKKGEAKTVEKAKEATGKKAEAKPAAKEAKKK